MLEAIRKLYKNTLFRLSLLGAFLFVASLFVAMGYVYYATIESELRRVDRALETEFTEFQNIFDEKGIVAVDREVIIRSASSEGWYALLGDNIAAGNLVFQDVSAEGSDLPLLTGLKPDEFKKIPFTYSNPESEEEDLKDRRARGLVGPIRTPNGVAAILVVARDVEATMRTGARVRTAILTLSLIHI